MIGRQLTIAVLLLAIAGCDTTPAPPAGSSIDVHTEASRQADRQRQTLWTVIDSNGANQASLPDDHPEVSAVRELTLRHTAIVDNRDHHTITASVRNEYRCYEPGFVAKLRSQAYEDKLITLYTGNHLQTRQVSISWYASTFDTEFTTARANIDSIFEITTADPAYLEKNQLKLGTRYTQHRTIDLIKRDGGWLISNIDKQRLTRDTGPPGAS